MKLREKLKRAKKEIRNQEKIIAGMDRRNRFLFGLCEEADKKIARLGAENEVLKLLLKGCVLAAGGEITVHTKNLKQVLEEYETEYQADKEKHTVSISVKEREQG